MSGNSKIILPSTGNNGGGLVDSKGNPIGKKDEKPVVLTDDKGKPLDSKTTKKTTILDGKGNPVDGKGNPIKEEEKKPEPVVLNSEQIIKLLEADDYKEKATGFTKEELFKSENGSSVLKRIVEKGLIERAQEVLSTRNDPIKKEDITAEDPQYRDGDSFAVKGQMNPLLAAVDTGRLDEIQNALSVIGESIDKDDMTRLYHGKNALHIIFRDHGLVENQYPKQEKLKKMETVRRFVEKVGGKLSKADFMMQDRWKNTPFEKLVKNGSIEWVQSTVEKNGETLTKADFLKENSFRSAFDHALSDGNLEQVVAVLHKNGETLTKADFINPDENRKFNPKFAQIVEKGQLGKLDDYLRKHDEPISRNDLISTYKNGDASMIVTLVDTGQLGTAQQICKQNGERKLHITDIDLDDKRIYKREVFGELLNVKDFSDDPRIIRDFWANLEKGRQTKDLEKLYRKALRNASVGFIYDDKPKVALLKFNKRAGR